MATTTVGPKNRHIEIPDGWRLLKPDEIVMVDDKVANIHKIFWMHVEADDIGWSAQVVGEAVIRKTYNK